MMNGLFSTPVRLVRELVGRRRVQLKEKQNIFKLGKECKQCHNPIMHRNSISICQCYSFAHKDCLMSQLSRQPLSECTSIYCGECKSPINVLIDFDYIIQVKTTWKDFILLGICFVVICLTVIYMNGLKGDDGQRIGGNKMGRMNDEDKGRLNEIKEVLSVVVMFAFGMVFWLTLMGMLFKRQTTVRDIIHTAVEIKVSAFLQLENKIRQQTSQQIPIKAQLNDY